jgi:hypothetical protein
MVKSTKTKEEEMGIFRVLLTGLCAYAPADVEFGDVGSTPKKVMVLMVNAMRSQKGDVLKALDGKILREHFPVVQFKSDDLTNRGVIPENGDIRWFFPRHEVTFSMDEEVTPSPNVPLAIFQDGTENDFNHGIHVKEVIDKSLTRFPLDSSCFADVLPPPAMAPISARVLITSGSLRTHKLDKTKFHLADTLGSVFKSRPVSNIVALEFRKVKVAHVIAKDLDHPAAPPKFLNFDCSKPEVEITIGNLCGESLGLEPPDGGPPLPIRKDNDFRAFYNIFASVPKGVIRQTVKGVSLPIPVPVLIPGGAGLQPVQCMRLDLHAQAF